MLIGITGAMGVDNSFGVDQNFVAWITCGGVLLIGGLAILLFVRPNALTGNYDKKIKSFDDQIKSLDEQIAAKSTELQRYQKIVSG